MADPLDPNDLVSLEELAISNMWEVGAVFAFLAMIQELRQREAMAIPPRRPRPESQVTGGVHGHLCFTQSRLLGERGTHGSTPA